MGMTTAARFGHLSLLAPLGLVAAVAAAATAAGCAGGADEQPAVQTPAPTADAPDAAALASVDASTPAAPPPQKPSMLEMQHALEQALVANVNDAKKTAALYAPDAVVWTPGSPETRGREAIEKSLLDFNGLFSNLATADQRVWTRGNTMAIAFVTTGIDKTSARPVGGNGFEVLTLNDDGLIALDHTYYDLETLLQQTGAYKGTRPVPPLPAISPASANAPEWHDAKNDAAETTNLANVRALDAAWLRKEDTVFIASIAPDFTGYEFAVDPAKARDRKELQASIALARKTMDASDQKEVRAFAVDDFTIVERETSLTQTKSKKTATVHDAQVAAWKDGKLVKSWTWSNRLELDAQLGTGPAAPAKH